MENMEAGKQQMDRQKALPAPQRTVRKTVFPQPAAFNLEDEKHV